MNAPRPERVLEFVRKPIWGFGPAGHFLALLLIGFVAGAVHFGSVQTFFLVFLHETVGDRVVYWVVPAWMTFAWFQLRAPSFGIVSLTYILLLCHLSPRPVAWWKYMVLIVWSILPPVTFMQIYKALLEFSGPSPNDLVLRSLQSATDVVCTSVVLALIMRRWRPVVAAMAGMVTAMVLYLLTYRTAPIMDFVHWPWLLLYHGSIMAGMAWWCLIERKEWRRLASRTGCFGCGYDLTGLPAGPNGLVTCPECNRERQVASATSTPA